MGINKIFDTIGGALNIFDFSFFISGSASLFVFMLDIISHVGFNWLPVFFSLPNWIVVISILVAIYISGLISWMIGRIIREGAYLDDELDSEALSEAQEDFNKIFDATIDSLGMNNPNAFAISNKNDIYSYMWIKLESKRDDPNIETHLAYCKRMWVMRALFEGLLFSFLLAILVVIDIIIYKKIFFDFDLCHIILIIIGLIMCVYLCGRTARTYARNQLKDIIIAYKIYVLEG